VALPDEPRTADMEFEAILRPERIPRAEPEHRGTSALHAKTPTPRRPGIGGGASPRGDRRVRNQFLAGSELQGDRVEFTAEPANRAVGVRQCDAMASHFGSRVEDQADVDLIRPTVGCQHVFCIPNSTVTQRRHIEERTGCAALSSTVATRARPCSSRAMSTPSARR
jgi:hypothetical protein